VGGGVEGEGCGVYVVVFLSLTFFLGFRITAGTIIFLSFLFTI
jgi:hypothetical protein